MERREIIARAIRPRSRADRVPRAAHFPAMAPLHEILTTLLPDAESIGAPVPADDDARGVGWVRVLRARVPALDVLEANDLVIVPASSLAVVAPGPADLVDLAQTLARSGASGLLLVPAPAATGTDAPAGRHEGALA
jgi:hypothetical protein